MTIDRSDAAASLGEIEAIARRVKQSLFYRAASTIVIGWGVLVALGYIATHFAPRSALLIWFLVQLTGLIGTALFSVRISRQHGRTSDPRILLAVLLFLAFGLMWSFLIGHFNARQASAFWPTLFMFGYMLAGLWLGRTFMVIGLVITALVIIGFIWSGNWFNLYLALVNGGGLIICGIWMRRA